MLLNFSRRVFGGSKQESRVLVHILILALLLGASVILNIVLSRKVTQLRNNITILKAEGQLQIGESVPPIEAKDIDGNSVTVPYSGIGMPTVLYIFSPQCGWCNRNVENIRALAQNARGKYRFIALSLSEKNLKDYLFRSDPGFPVYNSLSRNTQSVYKLGGTPQTIVVSADGKVQKHWMGAYVNDVQQQIEEYFHTRLPGLLAAKQ